MAIKISDLGPAELPLVGDELLEVTQGDPAQSRSITVSDLASGALGLDSTFVTLSLNAVLPNERVVTTPGGHKWSVWIPIFESLLQRAVDETRFPEGRLQ